MANRPIEEKLANLLLDFLEQFGPNWSVDMSTLHNHKGSNKYNDVAKWSCRVTDCTGMTYDVCSWDSMRVLVSHGKIAFVDDRPKLLGLNEITRTL